MARLKNLAEKKRRQDEISLHEREVVAGASGGAVGGAARG